MPTPRLVKIIPLQQPSFGSSSSSSTSPTFFSRLLTKWKRITFLQFIERLLPCSRWIRTYRWRDDFQVDLVAGLTIGVMLVPQAMSYAKLAGLQPIYGLYTGFVPIFVYAAFGSSRQLAIGPVALVSLLVSNVLREIAGSSDELYTELAIVLALMVGILECIMGLLRLGWLLRFISHSVISGFTTASAVVIGLSQAKYFLGYNITQSSKIVPLIKSIIDGADKFSWPPFVMGSGILVVLLIMKHLGKSRKQLRFLRAAGPLTGVILGTTLAKIFHPTSISLIGEIPQGLPSFAVPKNFGYAKSLIPTAFLITGVAILESVGIAKALAAKNGYELDSSQELVGLGLANIFGSFFSSYPSTGSFSRSAVSNESGAKSGLSGIVTGIVMGCSLLFMTPLFELIPQCALAAIVVSAVVGLVEYEEAIFFWRVDKKDFLLWMITCTLTLFLGIEIGVLIGSSFSRLRDYEVSVDTSACRGPEVERIYFVILEMSPVTYTDSSAIQALKDLHQEYKSRGIQIAISNPNRQVLLTLSKAGIVELIGKEWYFVRVHDAVQICLEHVLHQTTETLTETKPNLLERLLSKQRGDDLSLSGCDLESGRTSVVTSRNGDPNLEPLLSPP
ncbi:Sulfate transporter 4.1, chloroplastic [Linum perenne]